MGGTVGIKRLVVTVAVCLSVGLLPYQIVSAAAVTVPPPTRVSVDRSGGDAKGPSSSPSISADGRYVAFVSRATDLVKGDKNRTSDVFVRDLVARSTTLVSVSTSGVLGNKRSNEPSLSANGRYVAFRSLATNLVNGDSNGVDDIFVRDLVAKVTKRISVSTSGLQADAESSNPIINGDGDLVAFTSAAENLGPSVAYYEAFTHNLRNGSTLLAGLGAGDAECNGETIQYRTAAALSADGKHIGISTWCNGFLSLFDRVRQTGATQLVDSTYTGSGVGGSISSARLTANGSTIAWVYTNARGGHAVNFFNTATGVRESLDPPQTAVYYGGLGMSADGRRIVYIGGNGIGDNHIFPGATIGQAKIYSYDRSDGTLRYISVPLGGTAHEANSDCGDPVISGDGITAAFTCNASDLVAGDQNGKIDVFARSVSNAPTPNLQAVVTVPNVSVTEPSAGTSSATITVNLDRPSALGAEIQVSFFDVTAHSPADYDGTTQYVDFAPGQASRTVQLPIHADALAEGDETLAVVTEIEFGDVTPGSHSNAIVTIHNRAPA